MTTPQARRPDRMTGLPPGVAVGPLGRRFAAFAIDSVVPLAVVAVVSALPGGDGGRSTATLVGSVLVALWGLVLWWMFATRAAGPGMRLMKLQLVGFTDGRPIGWGRFLVRALILALLGATGIGLVLMLVFLVSHPRRQGWLDLVAGSVVIRARMLAPRTAKPATTANVAPEVRAPASAAPTVADAHPAGPTPAASSAAGAAASSEAGAAAARPDATRASVPATPAARTWVAELEDGRELPVTGLVLLGRNPQPRPGEEGAELVKLVDESRTVSKSHLALDVDEHGLFVVDRDSTNGSTFTTAAGEAFRCVPGQVTYLGDGAVVSIGDHRLTVRAVAAERDGRPSLPR